MPGISGKHESWTLWIFETQENWSFGLNIISLTDVLYVNLSYSSVDLMILHGIFQNGDTNTAN